MAIVDDETDQTRRPLGGMVTQPVKMPSWATGKGFTDIALPQADAAGSSGIAAVGPEAQDEPAP